MLGVIPAVSNSEIWINKMKEERERFSKLKEKVSNSVPITILSNILAFNPSFINCVMGNIN